MKKKLLSMVFFVFLVGLTACGGISTDDLTLPTTMSPTTGEITTAAPTTLSPTTLAPTTVAPTTVAPTTVAQTTVTPTTEAPTTQAPVYTRVYFYNVLEWTEVYGYSFAGETHHLGDWPGTLATQESTSLWWYVDVMVNTDTDSFKIIFTNNNQVQSGEVTIDDDIHVYVSLPREMKFTSKAEVESLISPNDSTTIWYYNTMAWESVWFYAWGNNSDYFGAWPGVEAVKDSESDWWSITIPFNTSLIPIGFKFHDNSGASINDVNINMSGPIYVTQTGEVFASKEEAEASLSVTTRVYFLNSNGWEGISAYDDGHSLGVWPGTLMTQVETTDWWYVDVVGDINNINYNLIFSSENGYGTRNVMITEESGVYVTVNSQVFQTLEEAEASIYPEIMTDVWFYNSSNWANVYAYAFNDIIEYTGKWPGKLAVREEMTDWYKVSVPLDIATEGFTVIFNNYQDAQTIDVILSNATDVYITIDGQVFSSKALAEEHMTVYTRIYFYNSNNWTDVYAYEDSMILGVWPGSNAVKDGETNWWYVDVVGDIQETSFLIKFHNNDTLAFRETSNVLIDSTSGLYITVNNKAFLTALDAENSIIAPVMTQVWFYNSNDWTDVNAYVFDDSGVYLGNWPGASAYQDTDPDWWFIGVPIDVATADFTIVFNDGHTQQTPNTLITQSSGLYVTVDGVVHLSKALAEEHLNVYTRIYFFNSNGWSNVVGYEDSTLLGSWPGTNATKDGETDWWYVDVLGDIATTSFMIKFHNADPILRETYNVTVDNSSGVYITVNSKAFLTALEAETSIYPPVMTTVWFHNTDLWSEVYAYAFIESNEYTGKWPGKLAVKDEFSDWYSISLPFDYSTEEIHLIFNNGSGMQSMEFVVNSTSGLYMISEGLMFDDLGSAETYLFPVTTVYFFNSNNWTTIYAYVFIDSDLFLGPWPGTLAYMDVDSGWWAIDVPLDVETLDFTVVFNDGDSLQTPDVVISTVDGIYVDVNGNVYTTKTEAENFVTTYTRVYFYNNDLWTDVNIEAYNTYPDDPLFYFSGPILKEVDSNWWYVDLPVDPTVVEIDFVIRDGGILMSDTAYLTNTTTVYTTSRGYVYESKALAEASMLETVTRVYFYNSENWPDVWGYAEYDSEYPLGVMPGIAAVQDGNTDWWYVDVPVDPAINPFTIYFHTNAGFISAGSYIEDATSTHLTIYPQVFGFRTEAEFALRSTTIYYYNSEGWANVSATAYNQYGMVLTELFESPGELMTQDGLSDWWYINLPVNPSFIDLYITFTDGTDFSAETYLDSNIYVYINNLGETFDSKLAAEMSVAPSTRVYFYNSASWTDVYAYAYLEADSEFLLTDFWSGTLATQEGVTDWWYIDLDVNLDTTPIIIIFNDGAGKQTNNVLLDNSTEIYINIMGDLFVNQWSTEASMTSTTVYLYNSDAWAIINAYVYGYGGELLGSWPGTQAVQVGTSMYWEVTIPLNASYYPFHIIFHDTFGTETPAISIFNQTNVYATVLGTAYSTQIDAENAVAQAVTDNLIIVTRLNDTLIGTKVVGVWAWGSGAGHWIEGTYLNGSLYVNLTEGDEYFIVVVLNEGETTLVIDEYNAWTNVYRQSSNQMLAPQIIYNGVNYIA